MTLDGVGFALDGDGDLVAGTLTDMHFHLAGGAGLDVTGLSLPAATLASEFATASTNQILDAIFSGNDVIVGDPGPNLLMGRGGYDTLTGGGARDVFEVVGLDSEAGRQRAWKATPIVWITSPTGRAATTCCSPMARRTAAATTPKSPPPAFDAGVRARGKIDRCAANARRSPTSPAYRSAPDAGPVCSESRTPWSSWPAGP